MSTIRGIRNNNPGNIRKGSSQWQGMSATQTDSAFVQFDSMVYGIRALAKLLKNYDKMYALNNIRLIITKYAPGNENNTGAYIAAVSAYMGFGPEDRLDLNNQTTLFKLIRGIIKHENGAAGALLISDSVVREGMALA